MNNGLFREVIRRSRSLEFWGQHNYINSEQRKAYVSTLDAIQCGSFDHTYKYTNKNNNWTL